MASLLFSPSGTTTPLQRWQGLATSQGKAAAAKGAMAGRPKFDSQPAVIAAWLKKPRSGVVNGFSPFFFYPEWDWSVSGDNATAAYTLADGQHVTWKANAENEWSYDDVTPGFDLGRTLNQIASGLAVGAALSGFFVFVANFIHIAQAIVNHEPLSQLGAALKSDYDMLANRVALSESVLGYVEDPPSVLFAIENGDWAKSWNQATNFGKDLSGITAAWAPGPAPDVNGKFTITAKPPAPKPAVTIVLKAASPPPPPKAQPMAFTLVLKQPSPGETAAQAEAESMALTKAANAIKTQSPAELAGVKAPVPTASNPQGGRTILGLPALDVGIGAAGVVALAVIAKVRHWF